MAAATGLLHQAERPQTLSNVHHGGRDVIDVLAAHIFNLGAPLGNALLKAQPGLFLVALPRQISIDNVLRQ